MVEKLRKDIKGEEKETKLNLIVKKYTKLETFSLTIRYEHRADAGFPSTLHI